ncbi:MAG TPA: hypothetical protein VFG69_14980 [Nannocystaceae bacterium]|nr:hypothetical protein [Nannocystaceae bacterium]
MSDDAEPREPARLRSDALRMLAMWRDAEGMPRAAKARVWQRLRGDRSAARSQPATQWVWAVALAAAALLVWWGVVDLRQSLRDDPARADPQAVDARTTDATEPAIPRGESARAVVEPEPPPPVPLPPAPLAPVAPSTDDVRPRSPAPRRSDDDVAPIAETPADPISSLARERELIARAWSALADGDAGSALQRAAEHELSFPSGILAPERRAIAIIARCKRGDRGADARARTWLADEPRSPLAGRVRAACIPPPPSRDEQ